MINIDQQRRIRLRHAERFDLAEILGEPVVVHVGEVPLTHQEQLFALLGDREVLAKKALSESESTAFLEKARPLVLASLLDERGDPITATDAQLLFSLIPAGELGVSLLTKMVVAMFSRLSRKKIEGVPGK
jgi:hypothetical protein